jgi:hypothetical protein
MGQSLREAASTASAVASAITTALVSAIQGVSTASAGSPHSSALALRYTTRQHLQDLIQRCQLPSLALLEPELVATPRLLPAAEVVFHGLFQQFAHHRAAAGGAAGGSVGGSDVPAMSPADFTRYLLILIILLTLVTLITLYP